MPTVKRSPQPLLVQICDLFLIELTNWRWSWRSLIFTATITPLFGIAALGIFARDAGTGALAYVLTGNLVFSLMFGTMNSIQSHFAFMRFQGAKDYFASLPVRRSALILAVVLAFFLLSLPSVFVTLLLGAWGLGLPLDLHPLLVVVLPLGVLPLAGIGALIGLRARSPEEAGSLGLLVALVLTALGPVMVPPERLPGIVTVLGFASPATYAASVLRQVVLGPVTGRILVDLPALLGFAALIFWWVGRQMAWRQA